MDKKKNINLQFSLLNIGLPVLVVFKTKLFSEEENHFRENLWYAIKMEDELNLLPRLNGWDIHKTRWHSYLNILTVYNSVTVDKTFSAIIRKKGPNNQIFTNAVRESDLSIILS